jgi:hypothetical protein
MASEERKAADQKIQQENFFASLGAEEQQAETDAFQCGRCKQVCNHDEIPVICLSFHRENVDTGKLRRGVLTNL